MEFDITQVYTVSTADLLKPGDVCIFADNLKELRDLVERGVGLRHSTIKSIRGPEENLRFIDNHNKLFGLAYLIDDLSSFEYKPYDSIQKTLKALEPHNNWIKLKNEQEHFQVVAVNLTGIKTSVGSFYISFDKLLQDYVFPDNTPCGEIVR